MQHIWNRSYAGIYILNYKYVLILSIENYHENNYTVLWRCS